ncbi:MAG: hypothetical protein R6U21_08435 [Thermoplasmatota archaeon]
MKKKLIGLFLGIIMLSAVPLAVGQQTMEETTIDTDDAETNSLIGVTFVAGYITNPQKLGNRVSARALALAYYDRGIILKDSGIAILKQVNFRDGSLLYMSEPNDLGLTLVLGICTGFNVGT